MISSKSFNLVRFNRTLWPSEIFGTRHCIVKNARLFSSIDYISTQYNKLPIFSRNQCHTRFSKYSTQVNFEEEEFDEELGCSDSEEILTLEVIKEVSKGDPKIEKQLKMLEFEICLCREQNLPVPRSIKAGEWSELLKLCNVNQRRKYLQFLCINEYDRAKKAQQFVESRALREILDDFFPDSEKKYGFSSNTMLIRVFQRSLNTCFNDKIVGAMMFYLPIIFDCSYDSYMTRVNAKYCARQLLASYALQRTHAFPLHVKCCNVDKNSPSFDFFNKFLKKEEDSDFLWDIHTESYLDLYPKDQLVYLSPHARSELKSFNENKVYIIGAFVDKGTGVKASLAKAKAEGLEMARFPLDRYLTWKSGGKSLPINTVLEIMLDLRYYKNWSAAFRSIPERKLRMSKRQIMYHTLKDYSQ